MAASSREEGIARIRDRPMYEELLLCDLGRIILYRKGEFRELRYEVRRPRSARGESQWRRALNFEEHKLLKLFMCRAYLQDWKD